MIEIVLLLACFCVVFIIVLAGWFLNKGEEGDECEVKSPDENGTYKLDDKGKCVLKSCASGYSKSGEMCVVTPAAPAAPAAKTYVEGDIVRITRTDGPLMLHEVMIYDETDKLISHDGGVTVTSSPTEPGWGGVERLTDFDLMNSPFHSLNSDTETFIEFKFSAAAISSASVTKKIKRIQILARTDERTAEVGGVNIEVLNGTTSVAKKSIPTWTDGYSHLIEYDPKSDAFMTTNTDGTPIKTTKIRLYNFGTDNLILAEIQVFDKAGTNIALTGTATLSTTHHPHWAANFANDGDLTNTAHSADGAGAGQSLDLDLGGEKEVAKVVVINRVDDIPTRVQMHKSVVQFFNGAALVMTTPPIPNGDKAKYEYKVGKFINRWIMT